MLANDWMNDRAQPDAVIHRRLDDMAQVEVASVDVIARPDDQNTAPAVLRQILAEGRDIATSFYTGSGERGPRRVGADGVNPDYDLDARGGHAVLLVGYGVINAQRYFIIGNSYGKYLERDLKIPLIRLTFPIFDRHHHHRFPTWGYQGALRVLVTLLDKIMDTMDLDTNEPGVTDFSFDLTR